MNEETAIFHMARMVTLIEAIERDFAEIAKAKNEFADWLERRRYELILQERAAAARAEGYR